ncbi:TetR/AcrR family transcriptional regulator [Rehaibacterium terrae]|uniref:AcrR family transcriptional regulator n=1 Tax=Rehaibacterium terrae TaxID=1341696 RepID=A0A7W7XZJ6_9GAMM|nr:TetR/AcrR family transcriptional regulator [Rehaibacterium terrae]MBB5015369.1 AcrR family transcriptional regulator [Rehaibacterium terrae]
MDKRSPPRRGRRPGRPSEPQAEALDARERLLDAALDRFVKEGIAASTLRAIADQAGVTPALLHYYFGDRQQLVEAVIEDRLMPALAGLRGAIGQAGGDLRALVRGFVAAAFALAETHPWLPPLWVREVLSEGGALRGLLRERIAPMVPLALAQRFAEAQRHGRLNAELDPRLLVVSLVGLTLFPLAAAPIWRDIFDAGDVGREQLLLHTLALLENGLELDHDD